MSRPLTIVINAQLPPDGSAGGIQHFVVSLVHALGRVTDGPERYVIVGPHLQSDWLRKHLGPNQTLVTAPHHHASTHEGIKRLLGPARRHVARAYRKAKALLVEPQQAMVDPVPRSAGFFESLGGQIVHFPYQQYVTCDLPTIFNPHDLLHCHYPQLVGEDESARRQHLFATAFASAHAIAAESTHGRRDIIDKFAVDPAKVHTILRGSPTEFYERVASGSSLDLPESFIFYPAQTWPHKNHLRLLEALALLRDRDGLNIDLVCSGKRNDFFPTIQQKLDELKLAERVRFLGFVSENDLRALYHRCRFVVFPSLFEGGGFPIMEAFCEGAAVACSNVTSLPEYGGDATLMFDPNSPDAIAQAVRTLWQDDRLRQTLRDKGSRRIKDFSWDKTARAYRALYRKVAGGELSDEDRALLAQ